ncbi:hypothetical protein BHE74_00030312, partial [Ensete ventricosum]
MVEATSPSRVAGAFSPARGDLPRAILVGVPPLPVVVAVGCQRPCTVAARGSRAPLLPAGRGHRCCPRVAGTVVARGSRAPLLPARRMVEAMLPRQHRL